MDGKIARHKLDDTALSLERTPLGSRHHEAIQHAVRDNQLSQEQADSFENAFDVLLGKNLRKIRAIDETYFALGQRLYMALDKIGYFGEPGKPLDYDSARTFTLRASAANISTDFGATLFVYLLSELRSTETRDAIKKELSQLISALEEARGRTHVSKPANVFANAGSKIRMTALALWLLMQEPENAKEDDKRI